MASGAVSDKKPKKKESSSTTKKRSSKDKKSDDKPSSSSKDRARDRDKSKDRRSKKPSSSSRSKIAMVPELVTPVPAATTSSPAQQSLQPPTQPPTQPQHHDPDAVQLFRRYDRARTGVLTRLDFLQLLKDYASPQPDATHRSTSTVHAATQHRTRQPLSLTDASGIPLGYERSDRNSEFEAGQLFERYDGDRTGTLTLDKFHRFFADFRPQLTAFVEDLNYGHAVVPHAVNDPTLERDTVPRSERVARNKSNGQRRALASPTHSNSSSSVISSSEKRPSKEPPRTGANNNNDHNNASSDSTSGNAKSHGELVQLLRVKDQMIFELLRERTALRKQKAAIETYVQELSDVSTAEMHKWSRLTDDMQAEIEHLRAHTSLR